MMKRTVTIMIAICFLVAIGIVFADYYHAIYVSQPVLNNEDQSLMEEIPSKKVNTKRSGEATVNIFGDQLIHENVLLNANINAGGLGERNDYEKGFSFVNMFKWISDVIECADLSICTQNTLVGAADSIDSLSGYPLFNAPKQLGYDLQSLGFDVVNVATNHMLDLSDCGYENSVSFWNQTGIKLVGGYATKEEMVDIKNKVLDVNGIKFGILAYTASTNGITAVHESTAIPMFTYKGSSLLSHKLKSEVSDLKKISDIVIVLVNWGIQTDDKVTDRQRETAQILVDAGADLIVGNGSTVLQPIEKLVSKDGEKQAICAYSLGNTLCTMQYMKNLLGGYLSIDFKKENESTYIESVKFTPTVIHYDRNIRNIEIVPLSEYSYDQFLQHGSNLLYGFGEYGWLLENVKEKVPIEMRRVQ